METVKKDCGLFNPHEWTKWEQFIVDITHIRDNAFSEYRPVQNVTQAWQKRHCVKCGKEQREEV